MSIIVMYVHNKHRAVDHFYLLTYLYQVYIYVIMPLYRVSYCCQVGDNQRLLQSLKDSPYYKAFEDKASIWEKRLADLDEFLMNLNQVQRKWVYLEPIFGRGALPKEQGRFRRVDDDYR